MTSKLKDRIENYINNSDYKLLNKLPIIATINGRGFSKNTNLLEKPYDIKLAECLYSTMMRLCNDLEGVVFGYSFNDEIVLVLRNDKNLDSEAWYDNRIQKMCSVISSIASIHFNDCRNAVNLGLINDPIFISQVFAVPNIGEAVNSIIYKQQKNFYISLQLACFYELLKKYNKNEIKDILMGLSVDEKIGLLNQEGVNFNSYPEAFRRGAGCYKVLEDMKNKWYIDTKLPIFTQEQAFLTNIFKN